MENCFVNQMKNGNTLTQHIIAKQPQVTTITGPQTISLQNIKRKHRANTTTQSKIQRFSPPVHEVLTENEKRPSKRSLKNVIQKSKTANRKHRK